MAVPDERRRAWGGKIAGFRCAQPLSSRLALAGVTTLVDAVNGCSTFRLRPESARQIALADRLVVAKSDLLPPPERGGWLAELRAMLRSPNPSAPILDGAAGEFGPTEFLSEVGALPIAGSPGKSGHAHGVSTFALEKTSGRHTDAAASGQSQGSPCKRCFVVSADLTTWSA